MKSSIIEKITVLSFETVCKLIRNNIASNGFLILNEINTQEIVARHGIVIPKLIQILFFHPRYISIIMENDPLAINEVPIKIVIREINDNNTSISFPNPEISFSDYHFLEKLALELFNKINAISDCNNLIN